MHDLDKAALDRWITRDQDDYEEGFLTDQYLYGIHEDIDFDARYTIKSMPGIAFYLNGFVIEQKESEWILTCDGDDCGGDEYEHDPEYCGYWTDGEEIANTSMVRAVAVGDDHEHIVDVSELTKISDDDYCSGCGQIGHNL